MNPSAFDNSNLMDAHPRMGAESVPRCPLCCSTDTEFYHRDAARKRRRRARQPRNKVVRTYYCCTRCGLVFVPDAFLLDPEEERVIYDLHQNLPDDPGYRRFLARLCDPVCARIPAGACGLDFGSGPEPVLAMMFGERGHPMQVYDPYYAPGQGGLGQGYSFITCSEVIEHIYAAAATLDMVWAALAPGGLLGIMTSLLPDAALFPTWRYKDDPTHVRFYSRHTFEFLAHKWGADVEFVDPNVILFRKT